MSSAAAPSHPPAPAPVPTLPAGGQAHAAEADLFLCPTVRLLADTPAPAEEDGEAGAGQGPGLGPLEYEYDGGGHCLVLPDKEHLGALRGCRMGVKVEVASCGCVRELGPALPRPAS